MTPGGKGVQKFLPIQRQIVYNLLTSSALGQQEIADITETTVSFVQGVNTGFLFCQEGKTYPLRNRLWSDDVKEAAARKRAKTSQEKYGCDHPGSNGTTKLKLTRSNLVKPTSRAVVNVETGLIFPSGQKAGEWSGVTRQVINKAVKRPGYSGGQVKGTATPATWREATPEEKDLCLRQLGELIEGKAQEYIPIKGE